MPALLIGMGELTNFQKGATPSFTRPMRPHAFLEGPQVVIEFPTIEEARAVREPSYKEAMTHRRTGGDYRIILVETK